MDRKRKDAGASPFAEDHRQDALTGCGGLAVRRRAATGRLGFTLIEIMVVVVIIGILAAVMITQLAGRADRASTDATKALLKSLSQAVEMFKLEQYRYPERLEDLLYRPSYVDPSKWTNGYITERPLDGWQREFLYRVPGTEAPYDIVSLGADGQQGGEGYNEDLWNHEQHTRGVR